MIVFSKGRLGEVAPFLIPTNVWIFRFIVNHYLVNESFYLVKNHII